LETEVELIAGASPEMAAGWFSDTRVLIASYFLRFSDNRQRFLQTPVSSVNCLT
jgi:hypothetical protein